jgi:excisionase family DNA binding protein
MKQRKRKLLSVKEVAAELGVSADTVRRAYWKGELPAFRICKTLRFDLSTIHRLMRANALLAATTARAEEVNGSRRRKDVLAVPISGRQNPSRNRPESDGTIVDAPRDLLGAASLDSNFLTECESLFL